MQTSMYIACCLQALCIYWHKSRQNHKDIATIPTDILPTPFRPDLVLRCVSEIRLLELTICSNMHHWGIFKCEIKKAIKARVCWTCGRPRVQGLLSNLRHNRSRFLGSLHSFYPQSPTFVCPRVSFKTTMFLSPKNLARTSISCSFSIYLARDSSDWNSKKQLFST